MNNLLKIILALHRYYKNKEGFKMGNKNKNDHVLSQAEIDALLTAISAGPVEDD
jgi:hypothetical protein